MEQSKNPKGPTNLLRMVSGTLLLILFLSLSVLAQKQDKKALELKKKKQKKDIELAEQLLKETKQGKTKTLNTLVALNKNIEKREEYISTINSEIGLMSHQIDENNSTIQALHGDIGKLKKEYARMVYFAYKNRDNYDKMMFVFAASDFNQAYKRLKYIQEYNEARKKQILSISNKQHELGQQVQELEQKKSEKKDLLGNQEVEKKDLTAKKTEKEELLSDLHPDRTVSYLCSVSLSLYHLSGHTLHPGLNIRSGILHAG